MYDSLEKDVFIPSIEAVRHLTHMQATLNDEAMAEIKEFVEPLRDMEVAIYGLCSAIGGRNLEPGNDPVFSTFVDRYSMNLARLSQNLHLKDPEGDETIGIGWQDLSRLEQQGIADTLLENQQELIALQVDTKSRGKGVTSTDIKSIKPYHTADGLRAVVSLEAKSPLSTFDLVRIYMRNKFPEAKISSVAEAYKQHKASLNVFEFRELFLRQGVKGLSNDAIKAYQHERDVLIDTFSFPPALASLVTLRHATDPEQKKTHITQLVTLVQLINAHIAQKVPDINPSNISDSYLNNFTNCGYVVDQLVDLEIDKYDKVAQTIAGIAIKDHEIKDNGEITKSRTRRVREFENRVSRKNKDLHRKKAITGTVAEEE